MVKVMKNKARQKLAQSRGDEGDMTIVMWYYGRDPETEKRMLLGKPVENLSKSS